MPSLQLLLHLMIIPFQLYNWLVACDCICSTFGLCQLLAVVPCNNSCAVTSRYMYSTVFGQMACSHEICHPEQAKLSSG